MEFGIRPIEGGNDFQQTLEQVEYAEELGFDSVWFAEHYTPDDQWWPANLLNLSAVAARTDDIHIGSNIVVTPLYHPVWLANATAMLDVISEGRLICGLGVGYDPTEFEAMGIPMEDRVGRTIESMILLKRLWTQDETTFDGEHFAVDEYGIAPRPLQDPRPPIWFGVWGEYLLSQAGKRADAWIPGAVADLDTLVDKRAVYDETRDGDPETRPLLRDIVVGDTRADAMAAAKDHLHEKYEIYAQRGHQFFTDYDESSFEEFVEDRVIVGTPEQCVDQIQHYREQFGVDHLMFRFTYHDMSYEDTIETMETIADDIIPAFR